MALKFTLLSFGVALAGACSGPDAGPVPSSSPVARSALTARLVLLDEAVDSWAVATTIDEAHRWAEAALNLVVGPNGPGYGDNDGDGAVAGANESGILPGEDGTPEGLALPFGSDICVRRDILGSDWSDPDAEWQAMTAAIEAWEPGNNTMPSLPSHPMRVVGWATFTLQSESLDLASEYAFHAGIHVDISRRALDC